MEYIRVSKAAEKWGISTRRVRVLCTEGRIPGVIHKGNLYMIPANAQKPLDGRLTRTGILAEIELKRERLNKMRPLTPGEVRRLQEEFMIEFTYNSNAIEGNTLTLKETAMVLEGMTIDQNRYLLKNRPQTYQHGDYHIGNMMIDRSEKLQIIDFNRNDYGNPWKEFNRIVWCVQKSPLFASGMVDGYFDGDVPPDFWKLLALYISGNTLSSIYWAIPFGQKRSTL